jgi:hypothetical protein
MKSYLGDSDIFNSLKSPSHKELILNNKRIKKKN